MMTCKIPNYNRNHNYAFFKGLGAHTVSVVGIVVVHVTRRVHIEHIVLVRARGRIPIHLPFKPITIYSSFYF